MARDEQGKPYTVRYEAVNAMLLNEFLKEHRKNEEQQAVGKASAHGGFTKSERAACPKPVRSTNRSEQSVGYEWCEKRTIRSARFCLPFAQEAVYDQPTSGVIDSHEKTHLFPWQRYSINPTLRVWFPVARNARPVPGGCVPFLMRSAPCATVCGCSRPMEVYWQSQRRTGSAYRNATAQWPSASRRRLQQRLPC